jgi:hypothetical protein
MLRESKLSCFQRLVMNQTCESASVKVEVEPKNLDLLVDASCARSYKPHTHRTKIQLFTT